MILISIFVCFRSVLQPVAILPCVHNHCIIQRVGTLRNLSSVVSHVYLKLYNFARLGLHIGNYYVDNWSVRLKEGQRRIVL